MPTSHMQEPDADQTQHRQQMTGHYLDQKRRAVLGQLDNAPFNRFHLKVCFVAGVGFFTDAYDLFAINIASIMLGNVYGSKTPLSTDPNTPSNSGNILTPGQDTGLKAAALIGAIVGQLLFGSLADIVGRKKMYGIELCVIIIATFAQAVSANGLGIKIIGILIVWRFFQGIGVGADYPLSAVISSEFAGTRIRGRLLSVVFTAQGWGQLFAAVVSVIVVIAFQDKISLSPPDLLAVDRCWRIIIGMGCIPATLALYFRLTIPETPRFTLDIERNLGQASRNVDTFLTTGTFVADPDAVIERTLVPKGSRRDFISYFAKWENGKILLSTAYSWFVIDIAFYGLGLNNSIIFSNIGILPVQTTPGGANPSAVDGTTMYQHLFDISVYNLVLSAAALLPGYYATFLLIDRWGRKPIQLTGFIMLTVLFIVMAAGYHVVSQRSPGAYFFLYCLANFFLNFGPNATSYIIPGESFPTRYRSTAHGVSAAMGKLGAIVGQVGFGVLNSGKPGFFASILGILAALMFTGIVSSLLIPETKNRTLEEISNEDHDKFIPGFLDPEEISAQNTSA